MLRRLFETVYSKLLSRVGLALLALALTVNIGALLTVDAGVERVAEARKQAVHSRDVVVEALAVQTMLYEAESAQRGYLYTGNESYLKPLNENEGQITARLAKLHGMLADNASQQKRLAQLRMIASGKMVDLNKTIALQKMGQKDAARALVMSDIGKQLMENFDVEISRFVSREEQVLQERLQTGAAIQLAIRWGFAIILFINALMILAGAVAIMRAMARDVDRDREELVRHDEREAAEVVQQDKRDAAEVVRQDKRDAAEVVQQDRRDAEELARHDEREAAEVVQQDKRDAAEVVQQDKRDAAEVVQQDRRDAEELVRHDEREAVSASEVVQRAVELRALTAHLLRVHEEERRTVARELHDELGGTLSAIKMDILMGRDAAAKRGDEKSVARMQRGLTSIDSGIQFIRRLIEDLRPTLLDHLGFEAALRAMTEQFSERAGCRCVISLPPGALNLTSAQSTALYRICQEALTNVLKYAKAKEVTITLTNDGSHWTLRLADDGVGLAATKQHRVISHGLLGMRERMLALDGTFDIRGPAGKGTTLTATFPVGEREAP